MTATLDIRPLQAADISRVAQIEALAGDVKWTEKQLKDELEKPISRYFIAWMGPPPVAAGDDGTFKPSSPSAAIGDPSVVGYVGGWIIPPELQITNIVIHPDYQCRGVGRQLLERLLEEAHKGGCTHSTLEVRARNTHAQHLYQRVGFSETGRRRGAYENPVDDAVLMGMEIRS